MKKYQILHEALSAFGLTAYPVGGVAVDSDVQFPYLTYEVRFGEEAPLEVHTYHYTRSESIPDAKAEEICDAFRNGGKIYHYDGGIFWITTDDIEWFSLADEADPKLKHRIINLVIHDEKGKR